MDEVRPAIKSGKVSCRTIGWCLDFCEDKNVDLKQVIGDLDITTAQIRDPSHILDWPVFAAFCDNFLKFFSEKEIRIAGFESWDTQQMRLYKIVGKLAYSVHEQYVDAFSLRGVISELYPCDLNMVELAPGHLKIALRTRDDLRSCRVFQIILAGQMEGLPASLGYKPATVTVTHNFRGADYEVLFADREGFFSPLRRFLSRTFSAKDSAQELEATYQALQTKYWELESETTKLTDAKELATKNLSKYQLLAENSSDVIWTADLTPSLRYISPSITKLLGYSIDQALQLKIEHVVHKAFLGGILEVFNRLKSGELTIADPETFEVKIYNSDGQTLWIECTTRAEINAAGHPCGMVGVVRDISTRKQIQRALERSEENYRMISEVAHDAIFAFDHTGTIEFANPAAENIFARTSEQLIGQSVKALIPEAFNRFPAELEQLPKNNLTISISHPNRQSIDLEISFAKYNHHGHAHFISIARDISQRIENDLERGRLETQLFVAQKMEAVGQLTGGIAHDFNNLLVAIKGYAELGMAQVSQHETTDPILMSYFDEINQAGERAADMTQKLLSFSRKQVIEPSVLDLCQLVAGLEKLLRMLLPENIKIQMIYRSPSIWIKADSGQIEQILINLAVNAKDAMPKGGSLVIQCEQCRLMDEIFHLDQVPIPGDYALIQVTDSGCGMPENIKSKIFEPFFTTKSIDAGTGLGMSVVFGIVKQHDGFINFDSQVNEGSTFKVYMPITIPISQEPHKVSQPHAYYSSSIGSETILMAEDNPQVRKLACLILEKAGFNVVSASDGLAALEIYQRNPRKFDLVILDVMMPKMGGYEVFQKIQRINPAVKVIFTSGYAEHESNMAFILEHNLAFIQKPYKTTLLQKRVRSMLDQVPAPNPTISY